MQRIIIKNFGPIKDLDLEIKDLMIFIGEQGTGKSTIAKLVWFFRAVCVELVIDCWGANSYDSVEKFNDIIGKLLAKNVKKYFGNLPKDCYIEFIFQSSHDEVSKQNIFINTQSNKKEIGATILDINSFDKLILIKNEITKIRSELSKISLIDSNSNNKIRELKQLEGDLDKKLRQYIRDSFAVKQERNMFLISGREASITYEIFLQTSLNSIFDREEIRESIVPNDWLFLDAFLKEIRFVKQYFINGGSSFESIKGAFSNTENTSTDNLSRLLSLFINKTENILKGKYEIHTDTKEYLKLQTGDSISLQKTSSGQKEVIRILQDLYLALLFTESHFKIIEEPEAHLFPMAQKHLCELFALFLNHNPQNQLMLTTHSPYILSSINNLLFAHTVAKTQAAKTLENGESVAENDVSYGGINKAFHLDPKKVGVYSLSLNPDQSYCTDILDADLGLISQNYLDSISQVLGTEFNNLYHQYAQNIA